MAAILSRAQSVKVSKENKITNILIDIHAKYSVPERKNNIYHTTR